MKKLFSLLCLTAIVLLEYSCSSLTVAGGSSSTDNGKVIGKVCLQNGKPASNALVTMRSADYIAQIPATPARMSFVTRTDDSGTFEIDLVHVGAYAIEVNDTKAMAVLFHCDIVQGSAVLRLPDDTIRPYAAMKGHVDKGISEASPTYVQIYGLERIAVVDSSGSFGFPDLPAGVYTLRIVSNDTALRPMVIDSIKTFSGQVTSLPYIAWGFSKHLYLNTSSSGAGVAGDVYGFPVLVRLTSSNFNFAQAKTNGDDVRFTKSDGTSLVYEIERWDEAQGSAEIWVKVDTVYGNNSMQYMTMYWGASTPFDSAQGAIASLSNSASVFDTSSGFQGVWHLGEATGLPAKDATGNHFDGTPSDTAPIAGSGMIGSAQQFNGLSSFFEMKNTASGKLDFPRNGTYSLSAWVWVDTLNSQSRMILTKGWLQYFIHIGAMNSFEFNEYVDRTGYERTWTPAAGKEWHYVTGVRSGSSEYLFVDGVCVDSTPEMGLLSAAPRTTTGNLSIGRNPAAPWYFFKGKIDEARIMDRAPGSAWIKLCYMNQKVNDALVKFQ
jgi:hypothetical protein